MELKNKILVGAALAVSLVGLSLGQSMLGTDEATAQGTMAPSFEVDPFWPKPMRNGWILGNVIGIAIDERDHVFIVHRASGEGIFGTNTEIGLASGVSMCCEPAPPIIEFDPQGNLVNAWGGPVDFAICAPVRRGGAAGRRRILH